MSEELLINSRLTIPGHEIRYAASRSSGPGGQHVNTSDTRIELRWDVQRSTTLDEHQRARIRRALASRINRQGELLLVCDSHRSQHRNKQEVQARLISLVRRALIRRKRRRRTQPTSASRERRLREKKRRGQLKKMRRSLDD